MAANIPESPQERYKRFSDARSTMQLWKNLLQSAYAYAIPNKGDFDSTTEGQPKVNQIWDATAIDGVQSLANQIQSMMAPPLQEWMSLEPGPAVDEGLRQPLQEFLQKVTKTFFRYLNRSNFPRVINEVFQDMAISTGAFAFNQGSKKDPFSFVSMPISQLAFEGGKDSSIENVWRYLTIPLRQVMRTWPNAQLPPTMQDKFKNSPATLVTVIEGSIFYPGEPEGKQWLYYVQLEEGKKDILTEIGADSPWITGRWSRSSNEVVGRGPVLTALPFITVLNKLVEYEVRAAKFRAFPIYLSISSSSLNPYTLVLEPGSIIDIGPELTNVPPIQPLQSGGDVNYSQVSIQRLQSQIREILLVDPLAPLVDSPQQTAKEVSVREQNFLSKFQPTAGRVTDEVLRPTVIRGLKILIDLAILTDKDLPSPLNNLKDLLDPDIVSINYTSKISDLEKKDELNRSAQWLEMLQKTFGQFAILGMEAGTMPEYWAELLNVDQRIVPPQDMVEKRFKDVINQVVSQIAQQQQPSQGSPAQANPAEGGNPQPGA